VDKKIFGVFVSLLVAAMLTLPMSIAFASKPDIVVNGVFLWTGAPTFDVDEYRPNGRIMRGTVPLMYTGDFLGAAEGDFVWNVHTDKGVTGRNFHTINVLAVFGDDTKTGSLVILLSNTNNKWRIISGTGDLENIHGTGTFMSIPSTPAMDFIYTGTVHFDP
jgi:hypothetical protein